jgi:hypothetical protein
LALEQRIENLLFVPLPAVGRKVQRLSPWAGMIKAKEYALTEGDFNVTEELLTFDPSKKTNKDDYIDACAHGPYMIQHFYFEIQAQFSPQTANAVQTCYQVAAI